MLIIWGTQFYGKVDRVPGLCYVVTRFGHLWFIPLVPTETYLMLDLPGQRARGLPIPMSGKSVLVGWLRAACVLALIISTVAGLVMLLDRRPAAGDDTALLWCGVWFVGSAVFLTLSYLLNKASPQRAVELGAHLGIAEDVMLGMMVPKDQRLKEMEEYLSANPDALAKSERRGDREEPESPETSVRED